MNHSAIPYGSYPETRTVDHRDDFHGTEVADPYRWLEDQNFAGVANWVRTQAELAETYLQQLPGRERLADRLAQLSELPTCAVPELKGGRWFRQTNDGQQHAVFRVADQPTGEGRVLIDPNRASPDGTTAIAAAVPAPTGRLVAWSYQALGSDWCTWRIRDVETGEDLADDLPWGKFIEPVWPGDSSAFVYVVYPPADEQDNVAADERGIILRTDLEAERGRLVLVDRKTGELRTLVAERQPLLQLADTAAGRLIVSWLVDARSQVTVHDEDGQQVGTIELPGMGTVYHLSASDDSPLVHLSFTAYNTAGQVLAHDMTTGQTETVFAAVPAEPGPELVTDQIRVTSADGTRLPGLRGAPRRCHAGQRSAPVRALRLWRLLRPTHAWLLAVHRRLRPGWWRLGGGQPARWRRVRLGLVRRRPAGEQAERLRRCHRHR